MDEMFASPWDLVRSMKPTLPVACGRPHLVSAAAFAFTSAFRGDVLYAVKANPSPWVIETLFASGITHFDVASLPEMELVKRYAPGAEMSFMHPVKSRHAIASAYAQGIRTFSFDCAEELFKIRDVCGEDSDLTLMLRVDVSNRGAELPIDGKFGAKHAQVIELLKAARPLAERLGLCFHPGSQCMDPDAWASHCDMLGRWVVEAGTDIDILDVGGGFPVNYPGKTPPSLDAIAAATHAALDRFPQAFKPELWLEPGRALVAEGTSMLVQVDLVRGNEVFMNDGAFGTLYDAVHCDWAFPVRLIRPDSDHAERLKAFTCYGPTCDSVDKLSHAIFLPEDIQEGDFIEFGTMGAYGVAMQSRFNGYGESVTAFASDTPWSSYFDTKEALSITA